MAKEKKCCVEDCNNEKGVQQFRNSRKYYCGKHYMQLQRNGEISQRNRLDNNEIVIYDDYAEIILYNTKGCEIGRTKIDINDIAFCEQYKWYLYDADNYKCAMTTLNDRTKNHRLHRLIMGIDDNKDVVVDHINGNGLDNRKCNLRICTKQENEYNHKVRVDNTTSVTGVYWRKDTKRWTARISVNKIQINLGCYVNFDEAVRVRKEAEEKYFGEYARKDNN